MVQHVAHAYRHHCLVRLLLEDEQVLIFIGKKHFIYGLTPRLHLHLVGPKRGLLFDVLIYVGVEGCGLLGFDFLDGYVRLHEAMTILVCFASQLEDIIEARRDVTRSRVKDNFLALAVKSVVRIIFLEVELFDVELRVNLGL